jgi:hypothetical protein
VAKRETPINAEAPAPKQAEGKKEPKAPEAQKPKKPLPLALKLVAGAVVLAAVFVIAAILGGGSDNQVKGPAPTVGGAEQGGKGKSGSEPALATSQLGYPAFATKNTTRIGGSEAAADAAGAALAVFPSATAAQSPAAVTIVDEAEWPGAIAASVLMSFPVRAPVLVSSADGIPDITSEALDELDPHGSKVTDGDQVFAIGAAAAPEGAQTRRVAAKGGPATAAAILGLRDKLFGEPPHHIVIAPLEEPAFAMPAAAWAARSGDPVLFAGHDKLPKPTAAALRAHAKVPVFVLGPSSAISSDVVRQIGTISDRVKRVSGEDPVANSIALARYSDGDFGWNVNDPGHGFVIARFDEPLVAAAVSPLSASGTWGPLLLTDAADTLPAALRTYLLDIKPGYTEDPTRAFYNHVWVIGDQEAIEVGEQAEIDSLAELAKIGGEG